MRSMSPSTTLGLALIVVLAFGFAGCSKTAESPTPVSPGDPIVGQLDGELDADIQPDGPPVSLRGIIRELSLDRRAFVLASREGLRPVRTGERTLIYAATARQRLRFADLQNGMAVEVRGVPVGRFVVARTVVVLR
jgi:hypothetical protein